MTLCHFSFGTEITSTSNMSDQITLMKDAHLLFYGVERSEYMNKKMTLSAIIALG